MVEIIAKHNFWNNEEINTGFIRERYQSKIISYLDNSLVKVLVGQRRVGKSYIMRMLIDYLLKTRDISPKNILYINKEIYDFDFINTAQSLDNIVKTYTETINPTGKIYIFIDEIQEIAGWEKVVNSLSQDYLKKYEIFISGSNSNLLSKELATYLSGRYIQFEILPFSYKEYLNYYKLDNTKSNFLEYLKNGGMPETLRLSGNELIRNYLEQLLNSIILKDIVTRYNIRDAALLERLVFYIIDSSGSLFSVNRIVNYFNSHKIKTNNETVGNYLKFIEDTFFIHSLERYDIKGKSILASDKKYYLNDTGFKFYLTSSFNMNIGRFLENLVYLHLRRFHYRIFIGKIAENEIDFIAEKDGNKKYIQVTYLLSDESIIKREFGNLSLINDNYEKIVLSLDDVEMGNLNGIKHMKIWEFLFSM
ncbi:MAG TPA: ATP-binding protein [Spirochaetota bacterium]|nr:ATP-binding protein [Spirochaetota bacterium]HOS32732.1 ATP-binding protein [Spirochaetota bacterium]HOS54612.1 ATP-binding protein [Spirochaetota bacterium]HPK61600.1 ATP-binding protein [Spirochaetota bacterium]HQF77110.1 ATP-binding protein [Spirochaetota bacterium]